MEIALELREKDGDGDNISWNKSYVSNNHSQISNRS
jgi:hypothetical protein